MRHPNFALKAVEKPPEPVSTVERRVTPPAVKGPLLGLQAGAARLSSLLGGPSIAGGHVAAAEAVLAQMAVDVARAREALR